MTRCVAKKVIEDECSVSHFQCELDEGHEGAHLVHYPGQWGEVSIPVAWTNEKTKIEFWRNQEVG